ncbi:MAG TPA: ATP-binding cassette domain-containing protein [Bacillales bacterium]|nr:ATP-binding cassette domain-containing protein [Bacillales bacterium]
MLIEMKNVSYIKEGQPLLTDIDWSVKEGEHWAILGLNGAGKTTLLQLVCGYLYPSKGTIRLFGKTFGNYPLGLLRKQIGWVSTSFMDKLKHHPHATAAEVVLSGAYGSIGLHEDPSQEEITQALGIVEALGLDKIRAHTFASLSQGEQQRVLIGRALMARPRLLILDEPCAGLDFLAKASLLRTIEQLAAERRTTVLYVTHQLDEILPMFQRTLLVRDGKIFSQGATRALLTSATLSAFCGTPLNVHERNGRFFLELG